MVISKKKSLHLKSVYDLSIFSPKIMATLHLETKILSQTKFLMLQGHRFAAHQCTCCGTLVCCGTEVGNHCVKVLFIILYEKFLKQGSQTQIALRAKQKVLINPRASIHKRSRIKRTYKNTINKISIKLIACNRRCSHLSFLAF